MPGRSKEVSELENPVLQPCQALDEICHANDSATKGMGIEGPTVTSEPLDRHRRKNGSSPAIYPRSEYLATAGENLVERFLEIRRRIGDFPPDLVRVLLPTLLDLVLEELLQCSITKAVLPLSRVVDHHVRDERTGEAPGLECWVLGEKWIHRTARY